jgi:uncharacterized protein YcbK (DUF882 family)
MEKLVHFEDYEFECKCGCGLNNMDPGFLVRLDYARRLAGVTFHINSGCRCKTHNKNVGGSDTSSHLKGLAVDIQALTSQGRYRVLASLLSVGFKRIGIHSKFIHVDRDPDKALEVIWVY